MTKQPRSIASLVSASILFGALAGTALYAFSEKAGIFPQPANAQEVALGEEEVRRIVRDEIAKNPRLLLDTIESYMQEQKAAEAKKADEQVLARKAEIGDNAVRPYLGNPDGTVEIVYFFDVNCGYCKRLEPSMKQVIEENPDVRVSMREMPILAQSSFFGAMLEGLLWKQRPEVYAAFHESLMAHQGGLTDEDIRAKLAEIVGPEDAAKIEAAARDLDNNEEAREVNNLIQENLSLARLAGITGTPFVFVMQGDGMMRGAGADAYEQLSGLVAKARTVR